MQIIMDSSHSSVKESASASSCPLIHVFGMNPWNSNIIALNHQSDDMLYIAGNYIVQFNTRTRWRRFVPSIDGAGISCMCVLYDHDQTYLVVGEKSSNKQGNMMPSIYIRSFPDFDVVKRLKGGAEYGYACMDVSLDGKRVCSVGMRPDYTLVVWDFDTETILLQAKAFGHDVYRVCFSPYDKNGGRIVTSGVGHIRFWEMANTFTGVKLKGTIGKFGKADLSDIHCFAELPSGKVLTGSEAGYLLLWEEGYVKCRFVSKDKVATDQDGSLIIEERNGLYIHEGGTFVVKVLLEENAILTAGADSCLRWWDLQSIECAQMETYGSLDVQIFPLREFSIHKSCFINKVDIYIDGSQMNSMLISDANGSLVKFIVDDHGVEVLDIFHSKKIASITMSPMEYMVATAGMDGKVLVWNIAKNQALSQLSLGSPCSVIQWIPIRTDISGRTIVVGFDDGCLRVLQINQSKLRCLHVTKPHTKDVTCIEFTEIGSNVLSSGGDELIFIHTIQISGDIVALKPIGCIKTSGVATSISFSLTRILYASTNGSLFEYETTEIELLQTSSEDDFCLQLSQHEVSLPDGIKVNSIQHANYESNDSINRILIVCLFKASDSLLRFDRIDDSINILCHDIGKFFLNMCFIPCR